jgi:molybdopterin/thiamine biosynthesis adenylyltransferase
MQDDELLRYSRHVLLPEIGIEGQAAFARAHAVLIGAGGLGCAAAMYLASSGIGRITIIDNDTVDLTNLQRQIAHRSDSIGLPKVDSARRTLAELNPLVEVMALQARADAELLERTLPGASLVLDCTDNFKTRHLINSACVRLRLPLVSAAAIGFDGQISIYDPCGSNSPCYACAFPPDLKFEETRCATMGVFAPLVGIVGALQACEALKLLAGIGRSLAGRLLMLDARAMEWTEVRMPRNPHCPICALS